MECVVTQLGMLNLNALVSDVELSFPYKCVNLDLGSDTGKFDNPSTLPIITSTVRSRYSGPVEILFILMISISLQINWKGNSKLQGPNTIKIKMTLNPSVGLPLRNVPLLRSTNTMVESNWCSVS